MKDPYMASQDEGTRNGPRDAQPRMRVQELCKPTYLEAPAQSSSSAASSANSILDPSNQYLAPQSQETFEKVARATMNEINRTSGRTLGRVVHS